MEFINAVTLVLALVMILMGVYVYIRSPLNTINRIYLSIAVFAASWAIAFRFNDYFGTIEAVQIVTNISYVLGVILVYLLFVFTAYFPVRVGKTQASKYISLLVLPAVVIASFGLMEDVVVQQNAAGYGEELSLWFIPYILVLIVLVVLGSMNLIKGYKNSTTSKQKSQIKYVTAGLITSFSAVLILADVIPLIYPNLSIDEYAPFGMFLFLYFSAKAIVQKRLFDLKQLVAKMSGFVLTAVFVSVVYVGSELLLDALFVDFDQQAVRLVFNIIFTGVLIFTYESVSRFFYEKSLRIFSEDVYDSQQLLDNLNQIIVGKPDLESLLQEVSGHIQRTLHADFCGFYIRETGYFASRYISNTARKLDPSDLEKLRQLTPNIKYKVHSIEVEPSNNEEAILNQILRDNNIELLGRLVDTLDYQIAGVGYLLLGSRKSKNPYSEQDMKILEIIVNELVIAIENSLRLEEIEQFNVTLQKKIDDATRKLKQSNDKLLALDQAKDEFVSMASHQLRTPLTSIKGYISMVLEGDAGPINETQKQMLGQAFFSSQRMVYLISDLLNVSRLKTGKFIIDSRPVNLAELIESEIEQLKEGARAKDLTLAYEKPDDFPVLLLDDMKIRQVIMNFIDNAIYYTPAGGKITVKLKDTKNSVEFTVKDTGIGVPKEQQHKLFTKFYRADNARKTRPDGTGLGIFMAKKVIVAQGGSILFNSKEGKGSTFGFNFPKGKLLVEQTETTIKT